MHIYSIAQKNGTLEIHAVGKNTKMTHRSSRAPSAHSRPRMTRRESTTSETESVVTNMSEQTKDMREENYSLLGNPLLTPTASVPSTPSSTMFPPPPFERSHSRRSSFSGSNAANSPSTHARYARSPSPMPALPAIRMPPNNAFSSVKLYGDESFTNFFRRLTFSPDGGLLLTPAGQFEDPSIHPASARVAEEQPTRGRKGAPAAVQDDGSNTSATSCVYIYSRANFARPPIARLPGHKKPSVAVKFSPILYELRLGLSGLEQREPKAIAVERGSDKTVSVDLAGPSPSLLATQTPENATPLSPLKLPGASSSSGSIVAPSPRIAVPPSPALSATDSLRPPTPLQSKPATPANAAAVPNATSSVFALPYRMLYAVATMDTVTIYDTQQSSPVCLLTKLHYDEFTDMTW